MTPRCRCCSAPRWNRCSSRKPRRIINCCANASPCSRGLAAGEALAVIATPDAALHRTLAAGGDARGDARAARAGRRSIPPNWRAGSPTPGTAGKRWSSNRGNSACAAACWTSYPSTENGPVRLEFFGDEIDSLRPFDPASQRSRGARARGDALSRARSAAHPRARGGSRAAHPRRTAGAPGGSLARAYPPARRGRQTGRSALARRSALREDRQ